MRQSAANPFASVETAASYGAWYETTGYRASRLEKALLKRLLEEFPRAHSLLEVGCGTGYFTRWLGDQGLDPAGLDLSLPMLLEAKQRGVSRCCLGDGLALPFPEGAFDLVAIITALEFTSRPDQALSEALRVARQGLLLGVLNRQSPLACRLRREGGSVWGVARFFSPAGLGRLVRQAAGGQQVHVVWRTTLWPLWSGALPLPWGGFIGMAVRLP